MVNSKLLNVWAALVIGVALLLPYEAQAASCCGGGSATSLLLPKFSTSMVESSFGMETYDGYWDTNGDHLPDPSGSDLKQYRLNVGYAHRLAPRWQASITTPYVWNRNTYSGISSNTNGPGDTTASVWYEAFDGVRCIWKVRTMEDLIPAAYFGASLTIPTGLSPYDDVSGSFDVTGRGFYRLDLNMLLDKTVYPWNVSLAASYGLHNERSVNREYGAYVTPYTKRLGARFLWSWSGGYTHFLDTMESVTVTLAYSHLREGKVP